MNPERIRAAIRLLYPDHITPTAKHVLERIIDEEQTHQAAPNGAASLIQGNE